MKSKKLKKSIVAACACCAMLLAAATSVSAAGNYSLTLERNQSYSKSAEYQGKGCVFTGSNSDSSARNVEFSCYHKGSNNKTVRFYNEAVAPGFATPTASNKVSFPDDHAFYSDLDVFAAFTGCYATAYMCVTD